MDRENSKLMGANYSTTSDFFDNPDASITLDKCIAGTAERSAGTATSCTKLQCVSLTNTGSLQNQPYVDQDSFGQFQTDNNVNAVPCEDILSPTAMARVNEGVLVGALRKTSDSEYEFIGGGGAVRIFN